MASSTKVLRYQYFIFQVHIYIKIIILKHALAGIEFYSPLQCLIEPDCTLHCLVVNLIQRPLPLGRISASTPAITMAIISYNSYHQLPWLQPVTMLTVSYHTWHLQIPTCLNKNVKILIDSLGIIFCEACFFFIGLPYIFEWKIFFLTTIFKCNPPPKFFFFLLKPLHICIYYVCTYVQTCIYIHNSDGAWRTNMDLCE